MKRLIIIPVLVIVTLLSGITSFAGSVPEDLLYSDDAQIFFAEVISYNPDKENPDIEVSPTKVIKGDVQTRTKLIYHRPEPLGNIDVKVGGIYLFTYFDENNPTDIFEVTSFDTTTLKLKNVSGDMWERFEQYLNEGRYLDADHARIDRENEKIPIEGEEVLFSELIGVPREKAEKVSIHCNGNVYDIDPNEFYDVVESIVLTDIEDVSLEKQNGSSVAISNGMYISVNGFDGYAFITNDCKVDKYGLHYSSLPSGKYTIKVLDRTRIRALFDVGEDDLSLLEKLSIGDVINIIFLLIGFVIVAGIALKFFCKEKIAEAEVINKQCFDKTIIRKNQASFNKKEYIITFKCGNKKLNFEVSELSYNNYRINQKGTLKYRGNRLIDFSERS